MNPQKAVNNRKDLIVFITEAPIPPYFNWASPIGLMGGGANLRLSIVNRP